MFSIYSAGYNIQKFNFSYEKNIKNWADFVGPRGQIVVAVNKSEDQTLELLQSLQKEISILELFETDISYTNRIDGLTKTAALDKCLLPIRCLMDFDEFFPTKSQNIWGNYVESLIKSPYDGLLVPSLDLWGSTKNIRKNCNIGQKFRIHKESIKSRGVISSAELPGGYFDTSKSDCTEALLSDRNLGYFAQIVDPAFLRPENSQLLQNLPFTVHESYLDFARKANHGKHYWKKAWEGYSNHSENVATEISELEKEDVVEHGLNF